MEKGEISDVSLYFLEDEDDFDFVERFTKLKAELDEQMKEETRINEVIHKNLSKIKVNNGKN